LFSFYGLKIDYHIQLVKPITLKNMKKAIITFTLLASIIGNVSSQAKIFGVALSPKIAPAKTELILNGGGVRTKYFIKVYVAGLYLQKKSVDAKDIVEADKPMAVRLHIISNLMTSANMATAIREGFDKSLKGNIEPFKKEIDMICAVFQSEPVKVGDMFEIYYVPGTGVMCNKNGKDFKVKIVGVPFKKALFGIWFSDNPVDENLKKGMLGL
jgi:Chalcone isomerase-like